MSMPIDLQQMASRSREGDAAATDALFASVYDQLRGIASRAMRGERGDHTLQTTALVHEVYLKLSGGAAIDWRDRNHVLALAARAMRRVLIDHARARGRDKRGGDWQKATLTTSAGGAVDEPVDLFELGDALDRLGAEHEGLDRLVEMSFFAGLTHEEIAELQGVSVRTVERQWRFARAWLHDALGGPSG